jgi:hypothetical protein
MSISKVSIFPKSLNQVLYLILHKFGAKLISDNFYLSVPEWFLFLYFKYWYFHSLKHFWDCDFNFVNDLELHQSMENDKWYNKRVLIWRFTLVLIKINYEQIGDQTGLFYTTNPVFYTGWNKWYLPDLSVIPARLGISDFFHLSRRTTVIQDLLVQRQLSLVPDNRTNVNVEACTEIVEYY